MRRRPVVRLGAESQKVGPQSFISNFTHSIICKSFFFLSLTARQHTAIVSHTHRVLCYYKIINITTAAEHTHHERPQLFNIQHNGPSFNFALLLILPHLFLSKYCSLRASKRVSQPASLVKYFSRAVREISFLLMPGRRFTPAADAWAKECLLKLHLSGMPGVVLELTKVAFYRSGKALIIPRLPRI